MKAFHNHAWAIYGALFSTCSAQKDKRECGSFNTLSPDAHVNSTGSMSFRWEDQNQDWHLTTTFNDTRDPVLVNGIQDFGTWISAPKEADVTICAYLLQPMNYTGTGGDGCEGILSEDCIKWLKYNVNWGSWDDAIEGRCARSPSYADVAAKCGEHVLPGFQGGRALDLSDKNCSLSSPPGNDMPDGYRTYELFGMGQAGSQADKNVDDFDHYDLYVRQTWAWILTTAFYGNDPSPTHNRQTQVLCQAPNRVLGSSRQPEGPWPPSAGNHVVSCKAFWPLLVAGIVGWSLVI